MILLVAQASSVYQNIIDPSNVTESLFLEKILLAQKWQNGPKHTVLKTFLTVGSLVCFVQ